MFTLFTYRAARSLRFVRLQNVSRQGQSHNSGSSRVRSNSASMQPVSFHRVVVLLVLCRRNFPARRKSVVLVLRKKALVVLQSVGACVHSLYRYLIKRTFFLLQLPCSHPFNLIPIPSFSIFTTNTRMAPVLTSSSNDFLNC